MKTSECIEVLEARIAPAKLSLIDVDGDLVTITTTKGTDADLAASGIVTTTPGGVPGGASIFTINLNSNPVFDGTSISIMAKRGPLGGDGLVNVFGINAPGFDLGTVTVDGDLVNLDAGKNIASSKVAAINVNSTSGDGSWNLQCSIGSLTVKTDVRGTNIRVGGASLGKLTIGGPLIGSTTANSGFIEVPTGTLGKTTIGGSIVGGSQSKSGGLEAKSITSVTVGGSLIGGSGGFSGRISATDAAGSLGNVTIKGDLRGGTNGASGTISSQGTLGAVTIGGSVVGGTGDPSGSIEGVLGIGKVAIGSDFIGDSGSNRGIIFSLNGGIAGVTIGGSVVGGGIFTRGGNIGPISIRGDLQGGPANASGVLPTDSGIIFALMGTDSDADVATITSITIGGSVIGRGPNTYGQFFADGDIGPVKIGGDLRGGAGTLSGGLRTGRNLGFVSIGGSMLGGAGTDSGSILSGKIAGVKIGGSLVGGDGGVASGRIGSNIAVGPITIGGDFIGRGNGAGLIGSDGILGAIFIGGSVLSFGGGPTEIVASNGAGLGNDTRMSIKSLTIVGSASGLNVVASGADDIIGPIKVGGDWREGSIRASINPGGGGFFGDNNDTANGVGDPLLFSKIASITIGGAVIGTASVGGDGFGFVAQEIGALSIGGTKIPLLPGHGNDTDATLSRYIISASRDFTVHEVA